MEPKPDLLVLPTFSSRTILISSLSIALLAVILFVYLTRSKSKSKGKVVLLVGNEDAGKTAIFTTLAFDQTLPTITSLQVNSAVIPTSQGKNQLCLVDIPGHPRLRGSFKDHLPDAKAIIFVVDVSTVTRFGKDVAENLHHVLHAISSLPPSRALPPLLILAHKTDLLTSQSQSTLQSSKANIAIARVRTVLERELEKRRAAQAEGVGIEGLGAEGEGTEMGGLDCRAGGSFTFAQWDGGDVSFLGTWSVSNVGEKSDEKTSEDGLDELRIWLDDLL